MPELPEVEIVRQSLSKKIIRKTIKKVIVRNRNLRVKLPLNFKKFLEKRKILNVDRFSKYLIFFLSGKNKLLIHLGMSGTIHLLEYHIENAYILLVLFGTYLSQENFFQLHQQNLLCLLVCFLK